MSDIVFIKNEKDYLDYKNLKPQRIYSRKKVKFICKQCGCESIKTFRCLRLDFLCSICVNRNNQLDPNIQNKKKQTCLKKYGVDNYNKTDECKNKIKATCLEKYGVDSTNKLDSKKEKIKNINLERYGVENPGLSKIFREKAKQTCLEKYGVEYVFQANTVKEKIKETNIKKYGVESFLQTESCRNAMVTKNLETFGVEYPMQNHDIRVANQQKYFYNNINFDSSWELAYYIWLTDNNIEFEYQPNILFEYYINDKRHIYHPDFKVNNELIEIKGNQFFDNDNNLINPYSKEKLVEKQKCMYDNDIKILKYEDLKPIFSYIKNKYGKNYLKLFKKEKQCISTRKNLLRKLVFISYSKLVPAMKRKVSTVVIT